MSTRHHITVRRRRYKNRRLNELLFRACEAVAARAALAATSAGKVPTSVNGAPLVRYRKNPLTRHSLREILQKGNTDNGK